MADFLRKSVHSLNHLIVPPIPGPIRVAIEGCMGAGILRVGKTRQRGRQPIATDETART